MGVLRVLMGGPVMDPLPAHEKTRPHHREAERAGNRDAARHPGAPKTDPCARQSQRTDEHRDRGKALRSHDSGKGDAVKARRFDPVGADENVVVRHLRLHPRHGENLGDHVAVRLRRPDIFPGANGNPRAWRHHKQSLYPRDKIGHLYL